MVKPNRSPGRRRRRIASAAILALTAAGLTGCSSSDKDLVWYVNPDTGGQAELAAECGKELGINIDVQVLPQDAGQQRIQLARRLAAGDTSIDLMSLDPPFTAEFANAGYLEEMPSDLGSTLKDQSFEGALKAATWDGKLYVAPFWSNTQVLWYRKSFVEKNNIDMETTRTWDQLIDAATKANGTFAIQGNKYEAYAILINALIEGAGGHLLEDADKGADAKVTIDSPEGEKAAQIIEKLAKSKAATADLSVSNEGTAASSFAADNGAFQINWTFIYNNYEANTPGFKKDIGYTMYPQTEEGKDARPPYGGIGIGVNSHSESKDDAMKAVECITRPENQGQYALSSGNMPASPAGYDSVKELDQERMDAEAKEDSSAKPEPTYPDDLLQLFQDSVDAAAPRVVSPYWSDISSALQSSWHPPSSVNSDTPAKSQKFLEDVLKGKTLL